MMRNKDDMITMKGVACDKCGCKNSVHLLPAQMVTVSTVAGSQSYGVLTDDGRNDLLPILRIPTTPQNSFQHRPNKVATRPSLGHLSPLLRHKRPFPRGESMTCCETIQIFTCSERSAVLMCADCRNLRLRVRVQKALEASR